jgi:hypothetical protein
MIVRSEDHVEYCRETAKSARTLHDLALRGREKEHVTRLIQERIAEAVGLGPHDDLVGIGRGDGTLLRMARQRDVRSAPGLLATEEEVALVCQTGLAARQGVTAHSFFAPPEEFIGMASAAGMEHVRYWRHDYPNTRNNYLFRKPK